MTAYMTELYTIHKVWLYPPFFLLGLTAFTLTFRKGHQHICNFLAKRSYIAYSFCHTSFLPLLIYAYLKTSQLVLIYLSSHFSFRYPSIDIGIMDSIAMLGLSTWCLIRFSNMIKESLLAENLLERGLNTKIIGLVFHLFHWSLIFLLFAGSIYILDIKVANTLKIVGAGIIIGSFTLIFSYTFYTGLEESIKSFSQKGQFLPSALLKAILAPFLVMTIGVSFLSFLKLVGYHELLRHAGIKEVIVLTFFWALFKIISSLEEGFLLGRMTRYYPDKTMVQTMSKLARILISIIAALIFFSDKTHYIKSILTWIGGGSALVVGFAAQNIIGNYLSGMIMHFEGNFKVGDWIYSVDKKIEGLIEYIGLRVTTLRTFDKRLLYVPNSFFSTANIINASKMTNRRIYETIPIERTNHTILDTLTYEIRSMLQSHPDIDPSHPSMVHFTDFGPSSLNINIYTFTKTKHLKAYRDVQQDVFLKIIKIIEKNGASLAFPTHTVKLKRVEKTAANQAYMQKKE